MIEYWAGAWGNPQLAFSATIVPVELPDETPLETTPDVATYIIYNYLGKTNKGKG